MVEGVQACHEGVLLADGEWHLTAAQRHDVVDAAVHLPCQLAVGLSEGLLQLAVEGVVAGQAPELRHRLGVGSAPRCHIPCRSRTQVLVDEEEEQLRAAGHVAVELREHVDDVGAGQPALSHDAGAKGKAGGEGAHDEEVVVGELVEGVVVHADADAVVGLVCGRGLLPWPVLAQGRADGLQPCGEGFFSVRRRRQHDVEEAGGGVHGRRVAGVDVVDGVQLLVLDHVRALQELLLELVQLRLVSAPVVHVDVSVEGVDDAKDVEPLHDLLGVDPQLCKLLQHVPVGRILRGGAEEDDGDRTHDVLQMFGDRGTCTDRKSVV